VVTYADRSEAGRQLAAAFAFLRGQPGVLVLGIPRGGIPVAFEIARFLEAPMDVWAAHKIGAPHNPELAIGSVTLNGEASLDQRMIAMLGVTPEWLAGEIETQRSELERRLRKYRGARPAPVIEDATVILVDDGLATGSTARAALRSLRSLRPSRLIMAAPVAPPESVASLEQEADAVVVLETPQMFGAVGQFYTVFDQVSDEEVLRLLDEAERNLHKERP
jgi:putative phosphoribosyl transferase